MDQPLPEPLAEIARLRREGVPDREIAARLQMSLKPMWNRIARWNAENPHARIDRPKRLIETDALNTKIAVLARENLRASQIATHLGISPKRVRCLLMYARKTDKLPPYRHVHATGFDLWRPLWRKGAAPDMGYISEILRALTPDDTRRLLERHDRTGAQTLAGTLAVLVKEVLNDAR
jgi:DNA-binding CsgD family transcriptional regulator